MPFRGAFECLWCGRAHRARSTADLEGWAMLCPECLGRAGENQFLRFRLRQALAERSRETQRAANAQGLPDGRVRPEGGPPAGDPDDARGLEGRGATDDEPGPA